MNIFLTSDTHFGHTNIIKYMDRPFSSCEEMDEYMIEQWNKTVGRRDVVWHLGDFAYGGRSVISGYFNRLNGKKRFTIGNHDRPNNLIAAAGENNVYSTREIKYQGNKIFLSHYAHRVWPSSHKGAFHAYGHSHGNLDTLYGRWGRSMDVGVDCNSFSPVSVEDFIHMLEGSEPKPHHPTMT